MSARIAITVDDHMLDLLDEQVRAGHARTRGEFIEGVVEREPGRRRSSATDHPDADND